MNIAFSCHFVQVRESEYTFFRWAVAVAQLVEWSLPIPEVRGSNPCYIQKLFTVKCIEKTKINKRAHFYKNIFRFLILHFLLKRFITSTYWTLLYEAWRQRTQNHHVTLKVNNGWSKSFFILSTDFLYLGAQFTTLNQLKFLCFDGFWDRSNSNFEFLTTTRRQ